MVLAPSSTAAGELGRPADATPRRRPSRIDGLDGLRALAVVAVLLYHAEVPWARGGFLGVDVFFVLSGYLVTSLVLGTVGRDGTIDLKAFWLGRARRLAPALLTVLVATTFAVALLHRSELADLRGQVLSAVTGTTNWYLIATESSYFDQLGRPPYLRHLWSIAVELQFYLFVPPVLGLVLQRTRARLGWVFLGLVAAIALSVVWMAVLFEPATDPSRPYYSTLTRISAPLVGVVLALLWRPRNLARGAVTQAGGTLTRVGIGCLIGLGVLVTLAGDRQPWLYRGGFLLVAALSAVIVAAVTHPSGRLGGRRALGHPVLVAVGLRSYGLYLWHWPVFVLLRPGIDISWGWGPVFVLRITLTIILTEACYRLVERPRHRGSRPRVQAPRSSDEPVAGDGRRWARTVGRAGTVAAMGLAVIALATARPQSNTIEESLRAGQAALAADGAAATSPMTTVAPAPAPTPPSTDPVPPADTVPPTTEPPPPPPPPPVAHQSVVVGDSVMVGAAPDLLAGLGDTTTIDAEVGRQASDTAEVVARVRAQIPTADTVVVQMGNNGPATTDAILEVVAAADGARVLFVNVRVPRPWEGEVNGLLAEVVSSLENAELVDWRALSEGHGGWFLEDGVHLGPVGRAAFALAIAAAIQGG